MLLECISASVTIVAVLLLMGMFLSHTKRAWEYWLSAVEYLFAVAVLYLTFAPSFIFDSSLLAVVGMAGTIIQILLMCLAQRSGRDMAESYRSLYIAACLCLTFSLCLSVGMHITGRYMVPVMALII